MGLSQRELEVLDNQLEMFDNIEVCESCKGCGVIDLGDCEDGVWETCPECCGDGVIEYL